MLTTEGWHICFIYVSLRLYRFVCEKKTEYIAFPYYAGHQYGIWKQMLFTDTYVPLIIRTGAKKYKRVLLLLLNTHPFSLSLPTHLSEHHRRRRGEEVWRQRSLDNVNNIKWHSINSMRWDAIIRSKWISATAIVARGRIRFDSTRWQSYGQIYQDTKRVLCKNKELQRCGQPFCIIFRLMSNFDAIFLVSLQENWMTYDLHHFIV